MVPVFARPGFGLQYLLDMPNRCKRTNVLYGLEECKEWLFRLDNQMKDTQSELHIQLDR